LPTENINIKWSKPIANENLWNINIQISTAEQMKRSKHKWIGHTLTTPQEATEDCFGLVSPR
jgi:hypothetical protein